MNRSRLFIRTLNDLSIRSETGNNDEYDILKSSGLLRQLLVDGGNLFDAINRERKMNITFRMNNVPPPTDATIRFWSVVDDFDPDSFKPNTNRTGILTGRAISYDRALTDDEIKAHYEMMMSELGSEMHVVEVDKQHLLSMVVLIYMGDQFSVRELIKYAANLLGGVHAGKPDTEKDKALVSLSNYLKLEGMDPVTLSLKAIGRVVVRGLTPLKEQIEDELSNIA